MTLPKPRADLKPNTADFERLPLVKPTGFREYDARWLFPQEINLMGLTAVGLGMATLFAEQHPRRLDLSGSAARRLRLSSVARRSGGEIAGRFSPQTDPTYWRRVGLAS